MGRSTCAFTPLGALKVSVEGQGAFRPKGGGRVLGGRPCEGSRLGSASM